MDEDGDIFDTDIVNTEAKRTMPPFPNPLLYSLDESKLKSTFGARYMPLSETDGHKNLPDTLEQILAEGKERFIIQGTQPWLDMRKRAQVTGSVSAELLGFHDEEAAKLMGLPKIMHVSSATHAYNEKWEDLLMRTKYGSMPRTPMDLPGALYCRFGSEEAGGVACMLTAIPDMTFTEVGTINVGPDQLAFFPNLVNVFENNAPIRKLPDGFRLAVTPDGDITLPLYGPDEDGDMVFIGDEHLAFELKTPTFFGAIDTQLRRDREAGVPFFPGYHFYAKNHQCEPYRKPKAYYMPQCFLEMLALKRRACLFASSTYEKGMNMWRIEMDERYLSLILSVLIYLYTHFTCKDRRVPTNFFRLPSTPAGHRDLYNELLAMTNNICTAGETNEGDRKPGPDNRYMQLTGTRTVEILSAIGVRTTDKFLTFPNLPEDAIPPYQLLFIYGRRMLLAYSSLYWPAAWTKLKERELNMIVLTNTAYTRFVRKIWADVTATFDASGKYHSDLAAHDLVKHEKQELAEKVVLSIFKFLSTLYGNQPFGVPLDLKLFIRNLLIIAMQISESVGIQISNVRAIMDDSWPVNMVAGLRQMRLTSTPWPVSRIEYLYELLTNDANFRDTALPVDATRTHAWQIQRVIATVWICKELLAKNNRASSSTQTNNNANNNNNSRK